MAVFSFEGCPGKLQKRTVAEIKRIVCLLLSLFSILTSPLSGTTLDTVLAIVLAIEIRQIKRTL